MSLPIEERLNKVNTFFSKSDDNFDKNFLQKENISFVYVPKDEVLVSNGNAIGLKRVYSNPEVDIYRVIQ